MNAATMGVATLFLRVFTEDKHISPYQAMFRARATNILHIDLPRSIEKHFESREKLQYKPYISTLATDGPSIVQIGRTQLMISQTRIYVENMLVAAPTKQKPKDPKVRQNKYLLTLTVYFYIPF